MVQLRGSYPFENFLQAGSIPSVWCPGCGIGTVINTFIHAAERSNVSSNDICVVSGIGCTGKVAYCVKFNSFQTIYRSCIRCASHIKLKNPNWRVVVFLSDADFMISGADDFVGIVKKGIDILVIYINNYIYYLYIKGKNLTKTPFMGVTVDKSIESPFNIPHLAESCGFRYIARWTPLHVRRLSYSMTDSLQKPGPSLIEVISPCLMYYSSEGLVGTSLNRMDYFYDNSIIKKGERTENLDLRFKDKIIVGEFKDGT